MLRCAVLRTPFFLLPHFLFLFSIPVVTFELCFCWLPVLRCLTCYWFVFIFSLAISVTCLNFITHQIFRFKHVIMFLLRVCSLLRPSQLPFFWLHYLSLAEKEGWRNTNHRFCRVCSFGVCFQSFRYSWQRICDRRASL